MSQFTTPLILKFIDSSDKKRFELVEAFKYDVGSKNSGDTIVVKEGYRTDFASIPRLFWSVLPPIGLYGKAAVIHDYLCDICEACDYQYTPGMKTREDADKIFLEAMTVLKVKKWKQRIMYRAVRIWGTVSEWKGKRRAHGNQTPPPATA